MGMRPSRLLNALALVAAMLPGAAVAATPPAGASPGSAGQGQAPSSEPAPFIVALDPGHGGTADNTHPDQLWDPGAISASGLMEKDLTLDVSRRVRALLQQDLVQVLMTRDSDVYVDISPRMEAANRAGAGIFVSIHFNAFTDPTTEGSVVLYPIDSDIPFAQAMSDALNKRLAPLGFADGGVLQKPDLWVHAQMPAVTVEAGYLSNAADAQRLGDPAVRQTIAASIRDGIEAQAPQILQQKAAIQAWRAAHPPVPAALRLAGVPARAAAAHLARWAWLEGGGALLLAALLFGRRQVGFASAMALDVAERLLPSTDRRVARRRRSRSARVRRRTRPLGPSITPRRRPLPARARARMPLD